MPHNGSPLQDPLFVKNRRACLAEHFKDCRLGRLRIVFRAGVPKGKRGGHIFEIGKINIDQAFQTAQRLHAIVAARVIDNGHGRTAQPQGLCDGGGKMCGVDKIDIVGSLFLQTEKHFRQLLRLQSFSHFPARADLLVLTEYTAQRASGKEYGSGATRPAQARLLPKMKRGTGYNGIRAHFAESLSRLCGAGNAAQTRTKAACFNLHVLPPRKARGETPPSRRACLLLRDVTTEGGCCTGCRSLLC